MSEIQQLKDAEKERLVDATYVDATYVDATYVDPTFVEETYGYEVIEPLKIDEEMPHTTVIDHDVVDARPRSQPRVRRRAPIIKVALIVAAILLISNASGFVSGLSFWGFVALLPGLIYLGKFIISPQKRSPRARLYLRRGVILSLFGLIFGGYGLAFIAIMMIILWPVFLVVALARMMVTRIA